MASEADQNWDRCVRRAQAVLDVLDEYDRTRNEQRLLHDLNRVVEGEFPPASADDVDVVEQRKDWEWDRAEMLKEMRDGD